MLLGLLLLLDLLLLSRLFLRSLFLLLLCSDLVEDEWPLVLHVVEANIFDLQLYAIVVLEVAENLLQQLLCDFLGFSLIDLDFFALLAKLLLVKLILVFLVILLL